jgi:hypothetical protein
MYTLALNEEKPEEKWFTHSTFGHHAVFNGSGKPIGRHNTNNAFKRLEKAGIVIQAKRDENATTKQGYRLVEFRPYEDYELL